MKNVIDVCCGSGMWLCDKGDERILRMDVRECETTLCDGRKLKVCPDILGDFRDMQFPDVHFNVVLFDPPHLRKAGESSWLANKYGVLGHDWKNDLRRGFAECFRVLKPGGTLVFKWNETQIRLAEILALTPEKPLVAHKRQKTHFVIFMKAGAK